MSKRSKQWLGNERGQSLVEMALVASLLLALVGGVVDFGSAFHHYIIVTNAAREGAREGSRIPCQSAKLSEFTTAIAQAATAEAVGSGVTLVAGNITISPSGCPAAGAELRVTVTIDYAPILGAFLGISKITISNSVKMVFFGNDQGYRSSEKFCTICIVAGVVQNFSAKL
ncbi:MAG: pilus assembly protein [Caldilineaceae bacterium]